MSILAKQVEIGKTYINETGNYTVRNTVLNIRMTKAGRYRFCIQSEWINNNTSERTINKPCWTNGAVGGEYEMYTAEQGN